MARTQKDLGYLDHTYVCLLAGGTGTRLWPRSRKKTPKQFAPLFHKRTLFQDTIKRVKDIVPVSRIFVITNARYLKDIHRQAPQIPLENIIGEPEKKNTAMAMGVASAWIQKRDPQAVVINLATDHLIKKPVAYRKTLLSASKIAYQKNKLVAVGIVPTFPHTGLGYIHLGQQIDSNSTSSIYQMKGFTEKPDEKTAQKFYKSGNYLWNANNYVYPVQLILEEFKKLSPDIYKNIHRVSQFIGTAKQNQVLKEEYSKVKENSIDYAISEKTKQMIVISGDFGWNDVGDWKVVYDLSPKDKNNNVVIRHGSDDGGGHLDIDSHNNLIQFDDQLIVTIGVNNLIIVDTEDALLICDKNKAEDVKKAVQILKKKKLTQYL